MSVGRFAQVADGYPALPQVRLSAAPLAAQRRRMGKKIGCEVGKSPTEGEMMSDDYVGLPEDEATVQAYNNGFDVVRIISRDGNYFPVTRDYREDRINFNIEETLVVQASVG